MKDQFTIEFKDNAGKKKTRVYSRWGQTATMIGGLLEVVGEVKVVLTQVEDTPKKDAKG